MYLKRATSGSSSVTNLTSMFHSLTGNESLATKRRDGRRIRNSQVLLGELHVHVSEEKQCKQSIRGIEDDISIILEMLE